MSIQGPDSFAISNVAVNRVEVRVANGPTQALTAPNASTAQGVNAYRFVTPAFAANRTPDSAADQSCYTPVPVAVTVPYGPALSVTRHLAFCPLIAQPWCASSSDDSAGVFSLSASAAAFGEASVRPLEGPPDTEEFVFSSTTAASGTLTTGIRPALARARVGYRKPQGEFQPDAPIPGVILAARLHRTLGTTPFGVLLDTFAESHVAVDTATAQEAWTVPGIPGARLRADVAPADAGLGIAADVASVAAGIPAGVPACVEAAPGAAALRQFCATANSNRAGMPARLNFFLCR